MIDSDKNSNRRNWPITMVGAWLWSLNCSAICCAKGLRQPLSAAFVCPLSEGLSDTRLRMSSTSNGARLLVSIIVYFTRPLPEDVVPAAPLRIVYGDRRHFSD